jgi:hypothetical protein
MAEYERSRLVQASPEDVFAFVSDVNNLATFVPTVSAVERRDGERVRIRGAIHDRSFEDDGWFHVEEGRRRVEWGTDEHDYAGWLSVAGDNGGSQVVAHLSLAPYVTPSGAPISGELPQERDVVDESLEAALDSLRNLLEGRGGKREPAAVH